MDAEFHRTHEGLKAKIAALMDRGGGGGVRRFIAQYAIFISSTSIVILAPELRWPLWVSLVAGFFCAVMSMGLFALTHETSHGTAFATRRENRLIGALAAVPIFYVPEGFRAFHFAHHRHTHEYGIDPELTIARHPAPGLTSNPLIYLGALTGIPIFAVKWLLLLSAALGKGPAWKMLWFVPERDRPRVALEGRLVLLFHVASITCGILYLPGLLHLLVAHLAGHAMLQAYLMAEHHELPHGGPTRSALAHTRTTLTHPFVVWLMWGMPYHAEHHAYPAVPFHRLPELHTLLEVEPRHVSQGYLSFHGRLLRRFVTDRPVEPHLPS
jgi:fatty acid desaturase